MATVILWVVTLLLAAALASAPAISGPRLRVPVDRISPGWAAVISATLSLVPSLWLALRLGQPLPTIHDDQSRLMQAQTFMSGRLANPPNPLPDSLETYHVVQRPTYASKYPPADSALLALGGKLFGRLDMGSVIGVAAACAAVTWMLAAFLPGPWTLLGGVLAAFHPATVAFGQSLRGGPVAMAGGALLVGAAARFARSPSRRDAMTAAVGLSLLANSRPYEGFMLSLFVLAAFGARAIRSGPSMAALTRLLLPAVGVGAITLGWMAYYNWRVTGSARTFPYQFYESQRGRTHIFFWRDLNPNVRTLDHTMTRFAQWEESLWNIHQKPLGLAVVSFAKTRDYAAAAFSPSETIHPLQAAASTWTGRFFRATKRAFPFALAFPLVAAPVYLRRNRDGWVVAGIIAAFLCALLLPIFYSPRYAAPAGGLVILLTAGCLRTLASIGRIGRTGAVWCVLVWVITLPSFATSEFIRDAEYRAAAERARAALVLTGSPGNDVVFVHYGPNHPPGVEVVFNDAEPATSPVIWARSLGFERDRAFLRSCGNRRVWRYFPDSVPPRLVPGL